MPRTMCTREYIRLVTCIKLHLYNTFPGYVILLRNKTLQKTQRRHANPIRDVTKLRRSTPGKTRMCFMLLRYTKCNMHLLWKAT